MRYGRAASTAVPDSHSTHRRTPPLPPPLLGLHTLTLRHARASPAHDAKHRPALGLADVAHRGGCWLPPAWCDGGRSGSADPIENLFGGHRPVRPGLAAAPPPFAFPWPLAAKSYATAPPCDCLRRSRERAWRGVARRSGNLIRLHLPLELPENCRVPKVNTSLASSPAHRAVDHVKLPARCDILYPQQGRGKGKPSPQTRTDASHWLLSFRNVSSNCQGSGKDV